MGYNRYSRQGFHMAKYDRTLKRKFIKDFLNRKYKLLELPEWAVVGKRCRAENKLTGRCNQPVYDRKKKYCYYHQKLYDRLTTPYHKWEEVKHEKIGYSEIEKAFRRLGRKAGLSKEAASKGTDLAGAKKETG